MWFTRVSIANPVFATMMMAALLVLGAFSYSRLPVEQFPDVSFPVVVVQTEYPGASPENVEEEVTRRVEESVNTISGIKTLSSRSYEGLSVVIIEFDLSIDPKLAAQDVREKIALIRSGFRDEIREPRVSRFNPDDFPIVSVAVQSTGRSLRELTTLADQVIKKRLENVGGVGQATLVGGVKREIKVYLNLEAMEAQRVGADETAFGHRDKSFAPVIVGVWSDPADNAANIQWVKDYYAAIHPHSGGDGGYVNFMSSDDDQRAPANYGANYARLAAVKATYDPDNLFHINQNIVPAKGR